MNQEHRSYREVASTHLNPSRRGPASSLLIPNLTVNVVSFTACMLLYNTPICLNTKLQCLC